MHTILYSQQVFATEFRQDWLIFDSPDEAMEYFNTKCGEFIWMEEEVVSK
jgi:hypothetical protein